MEATLFRQIVAKMGCLNDQGNGQCLDVGLLCGAVFCSLVLASLPLLCGPCFAVPCLCEKKNEAIICLRLIFGLTPSRGIKHGAL